VRLRAALETSGYRMLTALAPPPSRSGVLIAARCAFRDQGVSPRRLAGTLPMAELISCLRAGRHLHADLLAKVPSGEAESPP